MAREELEIEIAPDGKVTVRTVGIKGPICLDVAEAIARVLGEEEQRELTSEYYETSQSHSRQLNVRNRFE